MGKSMLTEHQPLSSQSPEIVQPTFLRQLEQRWSQGKIVCIGLDPDFSQIPHIVTAAIPATNPDLPARDTHREDILFRFNQQIIDATADLVCAYKPNAAFYEAQGEQGLRALIRTIRYIKANYSTIPIILDAKRADIGSTNIGYAQAAFDVLGVDAITVHPYLGKEALSPLLDRSEKGILVLVRTSNPGAGEFQDLKVGEAQEPLYQVVARNVANAWNKNGNCAVVVGATYPRELAEVRAIIGDMPILLPGIGVQGGEVAVAVKAGKAHRNLGLIISVSRGIIFAANNADFAQAARQVTQQLTAEINKYR
jgi:orotidine-5'-phosphate decarboxylase